MVNILLAGIPVEFDNRFPDLAELCRGFETDLPPALSIQVSDKELEEERSKQTDVFSDGYLETVCCYRKAANALLVRDIFVMHGSVVELDGEIALTASEASAFRAGTLSQDQDPQLQKALELLGVGE